MVNETNQPTNAGHLAPPARASEESDTPGSGPMQGMNGRRVVSRLMRLVRLTLHKWNEYWRDPIAETWEIRRLKRQADDHFRTATLFFEAGDRKNHAKYIEKHRVVMDECLIKLDAYEKRFLKEEK